MAYKRVLVTGASSGIGAAAAKAFAARGARLILLARNQERLEQIAGNIREGGGSAEIVVADLADSDAAGEAAKTVLDRGGPPDLLINNAGVGRWIPLIETSAEEAQAMIAVPYLAGVYLTRALLPAMIEADSGQIGFVSSPASYLAWPNATCYIAARHAVKGLADGLRSEMKPHGIGVSLIVLGTVETPYWEHNPGSRENMPETNQTLFPTLTPDEAAKAIVTGLEARKNQIVKPGLFRALFVLNALFPNLVASQLRKASKRAKRKA
ncbi:SDR family NAD(P)-dependent oxidoreductase [Methyloligella sp. 2.7D]|uniref:SDR family NAD(P)-dependent oxidoreductase n=1 Tax=unclassified Methyloligella TaxID=2625955 RepID=UPI00157C6185|nr:SDR family NAD(P)-dependent oxidoreductase [Methyloligella sp. GL2]QKP76849.1 SDR family NAD(P)-dependent oxidoreductase [Methyloligella sp. GL2]